jgi:hypothetical protein
VNDFDSRHAAAVDIFGAVCGESAATVRLLSQALSLAGRPLATFGQAFDYYADALEHPDCTGQLPLIAMKYALRRAPLDPATPALLERLEAADSPPWPQLGAALRREYEASGSVLRALGRVRRALPRGTRPPLSRGRCRFRRSARIGRPTLASWPRCGRGRSCSRGSRRWRRRGGV